MHLPYFHMTARSPPHEAEAEWFTSPPQQVNQRRYEALRASFVDALSYAEAGALPRTSCAEIGVSGGPFPHPNELDFTISFVINHQL